MCPQLSTKLIHLFRLSAHSAPCRYIQLFNLSIYFASPFEIKSLSDMFVTSKLDVKLPDLYKHNEVQYM